MDDIYGEIENYNDENTLQELRNENIELKSQVQKKALDIEKLQKDFDKIASEYKKLEINYSSLLKTARAEIERKTMMINNLNIEKDMMVLSTIQNCNKNISSIKRNMARDRANSFKINRRDCDSDGGKSNKNCKDMQESKKFEPAENSFRNEGNRLPSIDTVSSMNTDETNKLQNVKDKEAKLELLNEDHGESKENVTKVKSRSPNIRNRRKSMPVASKQLAKFSSDEELDDNHSPENANRKDRIQKDDISRRVFDRNCNDKKSHKVSGTSGIDEKYSSYHGSSRETCYKSKHNRYSDKYRTVREKYDPLQRYTKHSRDYVDEHHQRSEYGRHRVLESPPLERYDSQHRRRERRPNYDRENVEERYMKRRYETHGFKHNDEPNSKRVRRYSINKHPEENKTQYKDNDILDGPMILKKFENFQDISCQSPDYVHPDTDLTHPIREIMETAATHLEDPRLTSKKYITKTEDNNVILSTVDGRNVDLQVINTSTWDIPRVDLPEALQRPPGYVDEFVREVYMDVDNPVSNFSMESGEIHSETNDEPFLDNVTESYLNDYENVRNNQRDVRDFIVDVQQEKIESLFDSENPIISSKCNITTNIENDFINDNESSRKDFVEDNVDKQHKEPGNENKTKRTKYKISTISSPVNDEEKELISQKCTTDKQIKTKPENIPHDSENERSSQKYSKEHIIVEQIKETEKTSKCKITKGTENYAIDKFCENISTKDAKEHTLDVQQKETESLKNIGNPPKTNKYKIPKVKKPVEYMASQTVAKDIVKPLGRLLNEFNSTTKADKKRHENIKTKKGDATKLSFRQDESIYQYNELGDKQYVRQIKDQRAFKEVVEGDLELSDETSDNIEMNTQEKSKKFECVTISSHEQSNKEDSLAKPIDKNFENCEDNAKNQKTETCSNTIKIKIKRVSEENTKEPTSESSKKQKTKKKSHKHKGTSTKETLKCVDVETTDNNMPKTEVTPKEIKAKFTDLFGDSSSLITPEDLGVITAPTQEAMYPDKYVSMCEDAQDAIDVNVENICKSQISSTNASNDTAKVEETKTKEDQITNSPKSSKAGTETKKKRSKKSNIEKSVPIVDTVDTSNLFVNIIPEAVAKEPDVNTVIISTGVQPQIALDKFIQPNIEQQTNNNLSNEIRNGINHNYIPARIQQLPLALATSTPYKELKDIHIEADSRVHESSSSSSDNKVVRDVSSPAGQALIGNGLHSQNDEDTPDVRIFVRRRRKVVKKT